MTKREEPKPESTRSEEKVPLEAPGQQDVPASQQGDDPSVPPGLSEEGRQMVQMQRQMQNESAFLNQVNMKAQQWQALQQQITQNLIAQLSLLQKQVDMLNKSIVDGAKRQEKLLNN